MIETDARVTSRSSWQSKLVTALVRARMRPHAYKPIDASWVRDNMGRPRALRRLFARAIGASASLLGEQGLWPGGELVSASHLKQQSPVLLYLHGGGFIACSPETHRILVSTLVQRLQTRAYVPQYRLAPEYPYPAALHDAIRAWRYLTEERHIAPSRIVIAGDSAGGGLALSLALYLKSLNSGDNAQCEMQTRTQLQTQSQSQAQSPTQSQAQALTQDIPTDSVQSHMPAALVLFSPWTDLAATGNSLEENSEKCAMFAAITIRRAASLYVGNHAPFDPLVSPVYADFSGMPPMLIHASTDEVLRDDSVRVAERAKAANVDVTFRMWRSVPHVWQFFSAVLPEARESLNDVVDFVSTRVSEQHEPTL